MTLHFIRDRRSAASLRYTNRPEITVPWPALQLAKTLVETICIEEGLERLRQRQPFLCANRSLVCYTAVFSVVTQRSPLWGGALRDDTKNGCVAD